MKRGIKSLWYQYIYQLDQKNDNETNSEVELDAFAITAPNTDFFSSASRDQKVVSLNKLDLSKITTETNDFSNHSLGKSDSNNLTELTSQGLKENLQNNGKRNICDSVYTVWYIFVSDFRIIVQFYFLKRDFNISRPWSLAHSKAEAKRQCDENNITPR